MDYDDACLATYGQIMLGVVGGLRIWKDFGKLYLMLFLFVI